MERKPRATLDPYLSSFPEDLYFFILRIFIFICFPQIIRNAGGSSGLNYYVAYLFIFNLLSHADAGRRAARWLFFWFADSKNTIIIFYSILSFRLTLSPALVSINSDHGRGSFGPFRKVSAPCTTVSVRFCWPYRLALADLRRC